MNKQLASVLLPIGMATAGFAQQQAYFSYALKETTIPSFTRIVVNANVDIMLVEESRFHTAYVEGSQGLVNEISFTVSNGILYVEANPKKKYNGLVQVTIPVSQLSELEVNSVADVMTLNTLRSPRLHMHFNGEGKAKIQSSGKVQVTTGDSYDITEYKTVKAGE